MMTYLFKLIWVSFHKTFSSKFIRRTSQIYYCINLNENGVKNRRKIKTFYQYLIFDGCLFFIADFTTVYISLIIIIPILKICGYGL